MRLSLLFPDDHPNGEVDVKRADSGVGGDLGQSPMRRSLEEIMQKSSEHWSVVAASARHWQELARRRKMEASGPRSPKKKSSFTITEDMVGNNFAQRKKKFEKYGGYAHIIFKKIKQSRG